MQGNNTFTHKPWSDFAHLSEPSLPFVATADLRDIHTHRAQERVNRCQGADPIEVIVAYAQDSLVYLADNTIKHETGILYETVPIEDKVNKFSQNYRNNAPLLLHHTLADIIVDAAVDLYQHHGWRLRLYDGLRTMEAAYLMYYHAEPSWLGYDEQGQKTLPALLAEPGSSAHNRALAIDSSLVDAEGREIERFDHLDMTVNHRDYAGSGISDAQKKARLVKEQALQRSALKHQTLLAPLASEYWDDRMPGSDADLWRVMASLRRCIGEPALPAKATDYATFTQQWKMLPCAKMQAIFGQDALTPPPYARILFHEKFNPIYDRDLPYAWQLAIDSPILFP